MEIDGLSSMMFGIFGVTWILPLGDGLLLWLLGFVWSSLLWFEFLLFLWTFMVGFGLFGLCICLLPCMELRPLCLLLIAYGSFVPLFVVLFGPVVSPLLMLVLLDGPTGCDPCCCVVWCRFRLLRRYLALWLAEVGLVYRVLELVGEGCPGHGPLHLLSASAAKIGFFWDPDILAWVRPGLPPVSNLAGPIQHFRAALQDAWRNKAAADLCGRKGFRGGPLLDIHGSLQLLNSSHVRERDKALLRSIMVGGVWNGFLLSRVRSQVVPCRFLWGARWCWSFIFWNVPFLLLLRFVKILIFMISSEWIRDVGLVVCFDMVGFHNSLELMMPLLGLFMLLIVLATLLNLRLAVTLLVFLLVGVLLLALMLLKLRLCFLLLPMFGLMVALFLIG